MAHIYIAQVAPVLSVTISAIAKLINDRRVNANKNK